MESPSVANELNDLAATGDAYLGSVTFMSEGMRPLIKASTSVSLDSLGGSSAERGQPCTRTRTLTWRTDACNNVCAQAEAQLLGFSQLFLRANSHRDNICIWWQFEWINMKLKVQHYHVSVSKYLSPRRQFVLVTARKRESILLRSYICVRKDQLTDVFLFGLWDHFLVLYVIRGKS